MHMAKTTKAAWWQEIMGRTRANTFGGAERYLEQLKHSKVKGYLFEQQNYVEKS